MKYDGKLENDLLLLRPIKETDIEQVRDWRNNKNTRKWFINDSLITEEQQRQWYKRYLNNPHEIIFIIEEKEENNRAIGMASLYDINQHKRRAEFGKLFIGEGSARGKGYGSQVVKMICDLAFEYYHLVSVHLEVLENNLRGIKTYKKLGFRIYGESITEGKKLLHMRLVKHKSQPRKLKVLAFCYKLIPSAIVGVIEPLRFLASQDHLAFQYMDSQDVTDETIQGADLLICIRGVEDKEIEIVNKAVNLNKKVIYYLDDDLLSIDITDTYNYKYFNDPKIVSNINQLMLKSNYFWTNNPVLANKYGSIFEDSLLTDAPALLLREQAIRREYNEKVIIGYAGGMDHRNFFEEILYAPLDKLLKSHGNSIKVEVLGFEPYYMHQFNVDFFPYIESYHQYKTFMFSRKWDIALAPLPNSPFHSCKYFNKFLEYGAIGAAGIYSNVSPFTLIIENYKNGLLVNNNVASWYKAMVKMVEDDILRTEIITQAEQLLKEKFNLKVISEDILVKIMSIINNLNS